MLKNSPINKLVFFLCFAVALTASAQPVLVLENNSLQDRYVFKSGDQLLYRFSWEDELHKSRITHISDSSIFLDQKEYFLTDIFILAGTTRTRNLVGKITAATGTGILVAGQAAVYAGFELMGGGSPYLILAGTGLSSIGGVLWGSGFIFDLAFSPFSSKGKKMEETSGWIPSIKDKSTLKPFDEIYLL